MAAGQLHTNKSPEEIRALIRQEFQRWGIADFDIIPGGVGDDTARIEWWDANRERRSLSCSRFNFDYKAKAKNLHACWQMIEAFRKADQRGILREFAQAAAGFLEAPGARPRRPWYEVLGVSPATPEAVIKAAYKALAQEAHPDAGGDDQAMAELNAAFDEAKKERGFS